MLKQRIITAIILVPLMLAILYYLPPFSFCLLTGMIALIGAWEWSRLMGLKEKLSRGLYLLLMISIFVLVSLLSSATVLIAAAIWWLFATFLVLTYPKSRAFTDNQFVRGIMGCFVLAPCWAAINYLRIKPDGLATLLFLLILIWGADTGAYFVGKKWGKHKLAPEVSPGKSIEGFIGALVLCMVIAISALIISETPKTLWVMALILSVVTVISSVIGDLFESMIKRQAGVKDSGTILPGHGGLLDRIDSLTAAAPIFAFGAWLIGKYMA